MCEGPLGRTSLKSGEFGSPVTRDFAKEKKDWLDAKEK
jgi:hypothetical protein